MRHKETSRDCVLLLGEFVLAHRDRDRTVSSLRRRKNEDASPLRHTGRHSSKRVKEAPWWEMRA